MHFSSSASACSPACSALILPGPISNSLPLNSKNPPRCLAQSSMLSRVLQFLHLEHLPRLSVPHALYRGIRPFHDHFSRRVESWRPPCPAGFAFLFPQEKSVPSPLGRAVGGFRLPTVNKLGPVGGVGVLVRISSVFALALSAAKNTVFAAAPFFAHAALLSVKRTLARYRHIIP